MRSRFFVFLFAGCFSCCLIWPIHLCASSTDPLVCDLRIVASASKVSDLKIEVLPDPRSSNLILRYPTPDGIIRRLPAQVSEMAIGDLW